MNYREKKNKKQKTKNNNNKKNRNKSVWLENNWGKLNSQTKNIYHAGDKKWYYFQQKETYGQSKQILCDVSMSIKMHNMFWTHCSAQHPSASP